MKMTDYIKTNEKSALDKNDFMQILILFSIIWKFHSSKQK